MKCLGPVEQGDSDAAQESRKPLDSKGKTSPDALERAEAAFIKHHVGNIVAAADSGTWQASAWLLERRHPERFALRAELRVDKGEESPQAAEAAELDEIMEGSPKLRRMAIELHRAFEEEKSKLQGGNGNG